MMIETPFFPLMLEIKHTFNFSQATLNKPIHCKKSHKLLESAIIFKTNHMRQRPEFYQISTYLANIILHENNIKIKTDKKRDILSTLLPYFWWCFPYHFLFSLFLSLPT